MADLTRRQFCMTTMLAAGLLALGASHDAEADIGSKSDGRHHNRRSRRSSRRSHRRRHSDRSTRAHRHRLANRRFGRRRLARSRIARSDSGGFDFSRRRRRLRRAESVPPNAPQLVDLQVKVAGIPNLTGPTAIHRAFNWAIEDGLLTSADPASGIPPRGDRRRHIRHSFSAEKRYALKAWAAELERIVEGQEAANVIALRTS